MAADTIAGRQCTRRACCAAPAVLTAEPIFATWSGGQRYDPRLADQIRHRLTPSTRCRAEHNLEILPRASAVQGCYVESICAKSALIRAAPPKSSYLCTG